MVTIVAAIVSYSIFEFTYRGSFSADTIDDESIETTLNSSVELFSQLSFNLNERSEEIRTILIQAIQNDQNRNAIHSRLAQSDLWGITVLKDGQVWLWDGFTLTQPRLLSNLSREEPRTTVVSHNNVTLLLRSEIFEIYDQTYTLLTAIRLAQFVDLPYIKDSDYSLAEHPNLQKNLPVEFVFFEPVPIDAYSKSLSIPGSGAVGSVYIPNTEIEQFKTVRSAKLSLFRTLFITLLILILYSVTLKYSITEKRIDILWGLLFFLIILWVSNLFLDITGLISASFAWVYPDYNVEAIYSLSNYAFNAIMLFLAFMILHNALSSTGKALHHENHFLTIALSILFGALSVAFLLFFTQSTQLILSSGTIPLIDLELTPDLPSFLFTLFSAIFLVAAAGTLYTFCYHIFSSEVDKSAIILVFSLISFICFYFLADLYFDNVRFVSILLLINIGLFSIILGIAHLQHKQKEFFQQMSGFRKLILIVLLVSSAIYFIIWSAIQPRLDQELLQQVNEFTQEETDFRTDDILFRLLSNIEENLSFFSKSDVDNRSSFLINQFQRSVQNLIRNEWKGYSFHIRLLTVDNVEITSFSTALDTPVWGRLYDTRLMLQSHRGEQLRWQSNRPIIWDRPAALSERYTAFNRGWIPIYDPDERNNIIAWIAGEIYRERSDYQRPLRAVLSAESSREWKQSFYLSEYLGERLIRSTLKGIYYDQPQYNRLPDRELVIALQDSVTFITNNTASGSFREVLIRAGDRRIIKASTPFPDFNHHLFSFFRLQLIITFFGLAVFILFSLAGFKEFSLFGQNIKFKNRLIDGLVLATILFLTVQIYATQYTVGSQNEKNVERELLNSLAIVTEILKEKSITSTSNLSDSLIADLTTSLNTDLIIYDYESIIASTTPQIFQNFLIPSTMPFTVYDQLYEKERIHVIINTNLGTEDVLIGYRAILNTDGEPIGAIAIPTFLQSPIFTEQLLNTTSYLFVMYLFIFSLFIAGTVFLSNQLTKPLQIIQSGLTKISRGDLKTKVEVTSRDEIGSLAVAYNQMVQRLDETQQELMKAERESAWKEMAQQVAHEIKNPLTPMKLNLQHLQRQLEANPDNIHELRPVIEKTASNIIEQIESLNKIASDFSKFAKPVSEPLQPLNICELLDSVVHLYRTDSDITVQTHNKQDELIVEGVEDELRRVFINLIKNALEASGLEKPVIKILVKKSRKEIIIEVIDNGSGIDKEDMDKIFLPKFSTKSSGTGLGLAITKQIIEAHHGNIHFTSRKGVGTRFYIHLPLKV